MKKFGLALLVLLAIGAIVFVFMVTQGGSRQPQVVDITSKVTVDVSSVTSQKAQVIAVALADPEVQEIRSHSVSTCPPEYIEPGDTGVYVNDSEKRYACVYLNGSAVPGYGWLGPGTSDYALEVLVDTRTMKEMGVFCSGLPNVMNNWVIIPPGYGIYDTMISAYMSEYDANSTNKEAWPVITSSARYMNLTPAGVKLYPLVLDENDFKKFMNCSPYYVPDLIEMDTGKTMRLDGTMPLIPGWSGEYVLPPELQPHDPNSEWKTTYYAVILNKESEDIKAEYVYPYPMAVP